MPEVVPTEMREARGDVQFLERNAWIKGRRVGRDVEIRLGSRTKKLLRGPKAKS